VVVVGAIGLSAIGLPPSYHHWWWLATVSTAPPWSTLVDPCLPWCCRGVGRAQRTTGAA